MKSSQSTFTMPLWCQHQSLWSDKPSPGLLRLRVKPPNRKAVPSLRNEALQGMDQHILVIETGKESGKLNTSSSQLLIWRGLWDNSPKITANTTDFLPPPTKVEQGIVQCILNMRCSIQRTVLIQYASYAGPFGRLGNQELLPCPGRCQLRPLVPSETWPSDQESKLAKSSWKRICHCHKVIQSMHAVKGTTNQDQSWKTNTGHLAEAAPSYKYHDEIFFDGFSNGSTYIHVEMGVRCFKRNHQLFLVGETRCI